MSLLHKRGEESLGREISQHQEEQGSLYNEDHQFARPGHTSRRHHAAVGAVTKRSEPTLRQGPRDRQSCTPSVIEISGMSRGHNGPQREHQKSTLEDKGTKQVRWYNSLPFQQQGEGGSKGRIVDPALARARERNIRRLREADGEDRAILGKYLPDDVRAFFPVCLEGPRDLYAPSEDWLRTVLDVCSTPVETPREPLVRFGTSPEELHYNTLFLASCQWDMGTVYSRHRGTTAYHGAEFRPSDQLIKVIGQHPNFRYLIKMLRDGFDYGLVKDLTEEERSQEVEAQLERGNHKSATQNLEDVQKLLEGDVRHGFVIPFLASKVRRLKGVMVQRGGMVRQLSLKEDGIRKPKDRFTHDLSFSITDPEASINLTDHPDMVYGWCFLRLVHFIVALQFRHPPGTPIYLSKFDFSDAYKRLSQSARAAAATVVCFGQIAYLCWRMVFRGSTNPAGFSGLSETLTDLSNELAMSSFDPNKGIGHATGQQIHQVSGRGQRFSKASKMTGPVLKEI